MNMHEFLVERNGRFNTYAFYASVAFVVGIAGVDCAVKDKTQTYDSMRADTIVEPRIDVNKTYTDPNDLDVLLPDTVLGPGDSARSIDGKVD